MTMPLIEITPRENKWYGWKRGLPDIRDKKFTLAAHNIIPSVIPASIDRSHQCVAVMDQGELGCCVPHSVTAVMRFDRLKQGFADRPLSRLQNYYDGRRLEGTLKSDSGLEIRDAIKCAVKTGIGPESLWPYNIAKFARRPPLICYAGAFFNQATVYEAVDTSIDGIKAVLAAGYLVIIGISIYSSFESDAVTKTGIIPMPDAEKDKLLGGHCMYLHGYSAATPKYVDGRNHWNTDWGDQGDFHIPWDYLSNSNLAGDFWTIRTVE